MQNLASFNNAAHVYPMAVTRLSIQSCEVIVTCLLQLLVWHCCEHAATAYRATRSTALANCLIVDWFSERLLNDCTNRTGCGCLLWLWLFAMVCVMPYLCCSPYALAALTTSAVHHVPMLAQARPTMHCSNNDVCSLFHHSVH